MALGRQTPNPTGQGPWSSRRRRIERERQSERKGAEGEGEKERERERGSDRYFRKGCALKRSWAKLRHGTLCFHLDARKS